MQIDTSAALNNDHMQSLHKLGNVDAEKAREKASEFTKELVRMVMKESMKTSGTSFFGEGTQGDIYSTWFINAVTDNTKGSDFGLHKLNASVTETIMKSQEV